MDCLIPSLLQPALLFSQQLLASDWKLALYSGFADSKVMEEAGACLLELIWVWLQPLFLGLYRRAAGDFGKGRTGTFSPPRALFVVCVCASCQRQ